jgi:hypothetical protein
MIALKHCDDAKIGDAVEMILCKTEGILTTDKVPLSSNVVASGIFGYISATMQDAGAAIALAARRGHVLSVDKLLKVSPGSQRTCHGNDMLIAEVHVQSAKFGKRICCSHCCWQRSNCRRFSVPLWYPREHTRFGVCSICAYNWRDVIYP